MKKRVGVSAAMFLACLGCVVGSLFVAEAQQDAPQQAPQQSPEKLIPLKVVLSDVSINKVVNIIAEEEGIYKKNGLDVDQFISRSAAIEQGEKNGVHVPPEHVRDGNQGNAPIAIGGGVATIVRRATNEAAAKQDQVILATLDGVVHWKIMAGPGLKTMDDLKGKRLGAGPYRSPAMEGFVALLIAQKMGWDPKQDWSLVDGPDVDSLKSGAADAIIAPEIAEAAARAAGYHSIGDTRPWQVSVSGSGVSAPRAWVQQNPETVRRFLKSMVEAIALMKQDKSVAFRAIAKWYGITDPVMQQMMYDGGSAIPRKPYPSVDGIKKAMELYDSPEMRKYKPEDLYDDSFIRELDQSGFIDSLYKK